MSYRRITAAEWAAYEQRVLDCAMTPKFYGGPDKQPYLRRAVPLYMAERLKLSRYVVEQCLKRLAAAGKVQIEDVRRGWHYYRVVKRVLQ